MKPMKGWMKINDNHKQNDNDNEDDSNLTAAMNHVAENINLTVAPMSKVDDAPADKQVLIRATEYDRNRWKDASVKSGITLSSWIRDALNREASNALDCPHPMHQMRFYPWATICLECGMRFPISG